jgi:hypothetical protein
MLTAVILIISVAVALVLVLLIIVVVATRQEPRDMEMSDVAPSLIAVVVRRMLGVYLRRPSPLADCVEERAPDTWPSPLPPSGRR